MSIAIFITSVKLILLPYTLILDTDWSSVYKTFVDAALQPYVHIDELLDEYVPKTRFYHSSYPTRFISSIIPKMKKKKTKLWKLHKTHRLEFYLHQINKLRNFQFFKNIGSVQNDVLRGSKKLRSYVRSPVFRQQCFTKIIVQCQTDPRIKRKQIFVVMCPLLLQYMCSPFRMMTSLPQ